MPEVYQYIASLKPQEIVDFMDVVVYSGEYLSQDLMQEIHSSFFEGKLDEIDILEIYVWMYVKIKKESEKRRDDSWSFYSDILVTINKYEIIAMGEKIIEDLGHGGLNIKDIL